VNVFFHDLVRESLVLRIFYWIDKTVPNTTNGVPSELRLAIYEAFQAEGILLASPQRDIHLDASSPLAIQILQPAK
jgi:small-conductance mechanosensitive channel